MIYYLIYSDVLYRMVIEQPKYGYKIVIVAFKLSHVYFVSLIDVFLLKFNVM